MLGIHLMRDDAIRLIHRFLEQNTDERLRSRISNIRSQLDGGLDPKLSYLSEVELGFVEHFEIVGTILHGKPTWSTQTIAEDLNRRAISHPKALKEWKAGTILKHLSDFERKLGQGRLTLRSARKPGGLTDKGKGVLTDVGKYLNWLRGSRPAQ